LVGQNNIGFQIRVLIIMRKQ